MGMTYHKVFKLSNPEKSGLAFNSRYPQKVSPLLQWQKLGKWLGKWLGKRLRGPHASPCTAAGGQEHEGKEGLCGVPTIHKERHLAYPTYPQIQEAQELFSNTHNDNTAEGYSKPVHYPEG